MGEDGEECTQETKEAWRVGWDAVEEAAVRFLTPGGTQMGAAELDMGVQVAEGLTRVGRGQVGLEALLGRSTACFVPIP